MIAGAGAVREAAAALRAKTLRIAAAMLEAEPEALEVAGEVVRCREEPEKRVRLAAVHTAAITGQGIPADQDPGLETTAHFEPAEAAYAYGSAAALVSVDAETGEFEVERFVLATTAAGSSTRRRSRARCAARSPRARRRPHRGAALRGDSGQLLNGTMLDYFVPTASDLAAGRAPAHRSPLAGDAVRHPRGGGDRDDPPGGGDRQRDLRRTRRVRGRDFEPADHPELVWLALREASNGGERT